MKEIKLTRGKVTLVDDVDFDVLNQYRWHAHFDGRNWYAVRHTARINGKQPTVIMHREITATPKGMVVDHKDGDGLNNQKSNLRICLHSQNAMNRKQTADRIVSRFKGVSWNMRHKKWRARIGVGGEVKHLGCFDSEEEAARVYDAIAMIVHGEFARINFGATLCA